MRPETTPAMKTPRRLLLRPILGVAAFVLPALMAAAGETAPPAPPAAPSHVLYMGADLSVARGKKLYRVEDVTGSEFRIKINGEEVLVPTRRGPVDLHVDADLKLSAFSVQLDELHAGEGYTYGNDPARKLEEATRNQMVTQDRQDYAKAGIEHADANLIAVQKMADNGGFGTAERAQREIATAQAQVQDSNSYSDSANISASSDSSNTGSGALRMAMAAGNFDAMEVSFKVSSPVELDQPYVVILFRFHDPAAKPGANGLVIHAQALDPIDAKPRYVRILQGGLPVGFKYVDSTVHVYNRGVEAATNLSANRVEMSRHETQQYLLIQHRSAHKGESLPAAVVAGTLSRARRASLTPNQLTRTFYAKVTSDGSLLGIFADEDCSAPLEDAEVLTAAHEVFFMPALEAGKPVDGVARVRLSRL